MNGSSIKQMALAAAFGLAATALAATPTLSHAFDPGKVEAKAHDRAKKAAERAKKEEARAIKKGKVGFYKAAICFRREGVRRRSDEGSEEQPRL